MSRDTRSKVLPAAIALLLASGSVATGDQLPPPIYMGQWGTTGSGPSQFNSPGSVAIAGDGRRFVADRGNTRVQVFDSNNASLAIVTASGGGLPLDPDDIAVGPDGSLFFLEDTGILQRFDSAYQKRQEWTTAIDGGAIPGVNFHRIATSQHYLFLAVGTDPSSADSNANIVRMAVADTTDTTRVTFTLEDPAQYQIVLAEDAMATDIYDNLYVIMRYRTSLDGPLLTALRKYTSSGTMLKAWTLPAGGYSGLTVDRAGAIYCLNATNGTLDVIANDTLETSFHFAGGSGTGGSLLSPGGLAADSTCGLFVTDERDRVLRLMIDRDRDGLCDAWERDGLLVVGDSSKFMLNGAHVQDPDIFVEVDCMDSVLFDTTQALPLVASKFLANGIYLHVTMDELGLTSVAWRDSGWKHFQEYKAVHFGSPGDGGGLKQAKALAYRYCVFGDSLISRGKAVGGKGEIGGNDFAVTQGVTRRNDSTRVVPWRSQAGVFMHELGHTLGLRHGGGNDINHKPNSLLSGLLT